MRVKEIMSQRIVTVTMDDRLSDIKKIFDNVHFHHLMVVDDENHLIGILTEGDMLTALSPYIGFDSAQNHDLATLNKRAHQVMTRSPVTVTEQTPVAEVCNIFVSMGIGCVPVVDALGSLVGLVTWRDVVRLLPALLA
jgi:acetoin utilization protein AcuB